MMRDDVKQVARLRSKLKALSLFVDAVVRAGNLPASDVRGGLRRGGGGVIR